MATVQTKYPNVHDQWLEGQIADTSTCDVDSYTAGADINFGRAVHGTAASVTMGIGTAESFRGIALMDQRVPATAGEKYPKGEVVSVLWRGDVAVKVDAAVTTGGIPTVNTTSGKIGVTAADATHIALTKSRFITGAAAGGIAILRVDGLEPAA